MPQCNDSRAWVLIRLLFHPYSFGSVVPCVWSFWFETALPLLAEIPIVGGGPRATDAVITLRKGF